MTRQLGDDGVYRRVETVDYFVKSHNSEDILAITLCENLPDEAQTALIGCYMYYLGMDLVMYALVNFTNQYCQGIGNGTQKPTFVYLLRASYAESFGNDKAEPWERYSAAVGMAENASDDFTFELVFKRADKAMYEDKKQFKKTHGSYR